MRRQILKKIKQIWPAILGLIIVSFYLTSALKLIHYPQHLFIILLLAVGPVAITGVLFISRQLSEHGYGIPLQLAKIFGCIAFAIWEIVICIQVGTRIYYKEHLLNSVADESAKQTHMLMYKGVNSIQFTMDIAFDIFYCLLIILFGYQMYQNRDFGKAVGLFGIFGGLGLLVLNLWTFPYPPAESGLVDLGPLTGIWWVWVIILMFRKEYRIKV